MTNNEREQAKAKCVEMQKFCKNCARLNHSFVKRGNGTYISLTNVTYSGEIFTKEILVHNFILLSDVGMKRFADSYLNR